MAVRTRSGLRRYLTLLVSGTLVGVIGALGLLAGQAAGQQSRDVHREDRLALQRTLAGLVEQYVLLSAAEVYDELGRTGSWSSAAGDPATVRRLEDLVTRTRALDAGAVLVSGLGKPLASWSGGAPLPASDDPGWAPLRASVLSGKKTLPVSGILKAGDTSLLAMGLPVPLADGTRGLVLGLWDAKKNGLQQYVSELTYGETGHGYIVDKRGLVIAGPSPEVVGTLLPLPRLLAGLMEGGKDGILDTADADEPLITSYARAGSTGWTALTPQSRSEFEGALVQSSRVVQVLVVALLLISGTALVVLHRKRERALESMALRDELTGLYNRRGWFVVAEHELERARRQATARVLLFIDVDGLKQVNDALGHREGDRAIVDAAAVLRAASRSSDIVGRLGGDEFVLLLNEDGKADVARRRVAEALRAHNERSGAGFELRMSIGAEVWFPDAASSLEELLRAADAEMYADKQSRPTRHEGLLRLPMQRSSDSETKAVAR